MKTTFGSVLFCGTVPLKFKCGMLPHLDFNETCVGEVEKFTVRPNEQVGEVKTIASFCVRY